MGVYKLTAGYELKGWRNIPYALVSADKHLVKRLSFGESLLILSCDGQTELEDSPEVERLLGRKVIERLDAPAKAGSPAPSYERCDRYYRYVAQVAITGRCNLHCRHCLAADGDENVSTQLSLEQCVHIFDEMVASDIFRLWITGGEPLVHPDFRAIFQSAVEHGLKVDSLFTNAWLIDAEILDFIEDLGQKPEFVVSFDGIGTHDWMRNCAGAQERTLEKISLLSERGFSVRIGLNVNSVTAPGVIDTCRTLVNEYGVNSVRPIYTSPTPRWNAALSEGLTRFEPGDYYDLMIELMRTSRVERWEATIDVVHMPKLHRAPKNARTWDLLRNPPAALPERKIMASCGRATNVVFISSDGRVLPCSTYEGESNLLKLFQGDDVNVLKRPLSEILSNSEYTREFEVSIADLQRQEPACAGCKWVSVCCGGCPLYTWGRKYVDIPDPICTLYKDGYATKYLKMLEETEEL